MGQVELTFGQVDFGSFVLNHIYIDSLVQDCCNSIANALELLQSCTKPLISSLLQNVKFWKLSKWKFLDTLSPEHQFDIDPTCIRSVHIDLTLIWHVSDQCLISIDPSIFVICDTRHVWVVGRSPSSFGSRIDDLIINVGRFLAASPAR